MQADHQSFLPDPSPAKSRTLFIVALVSALLGLTLLDVAPSTAAKRSLHAGARSIDCIVASAVFAGVSSHPGTTP